MSDLLRTVLYWVAGFAALATSVRALRAVYVGLRSLRRQQQISQLSGDGFYRLHSVESLRSELPRLGNQQPEHVPRPEVPDGVPGFGEVLVITGDPQTGKTCEAYHAVASIAEQHGLTALSVLCPASGASMAVPSRLPPGCHQNVVVLLDNLHDFAVAQSRIALVLAQTLEVLRTSLGGGFYAIIMTTETRYEGSLPRWLGHLHGRATHVRLPRMEGDIEERYLRELCRLFRLSVSDAALVDLAQANDGTVVAAYDVLRESAERGRSHVTDADVHRLRERVGREWLQAVGPLLSNMERYALALLSQLRGCGVPLMPWIAETVHQRLSVETGTSGGLTGQWLRRWRFRHALARLGETYVPLSDTGTFTPHDARLQNWDGDRLAQACQVARALVPLHGVRPVPQGLRLAYAGIADTLERVGRYDLALPVLRAWLATSSSSGRHVSEVDALVESLTLPREAPPEGSARWAWVRQEVARAYDDLPTGSIDVNLRKAIDGYEAALGTFGESGSQLQCAATLVNLGNVYVHLPTGNRNENLWTAIEYDRSALEVYSRDAYPEQWAAIHNDMGNAYQYLPDGDIASNVRTAIQCYEKALTVRSREAADREWAVTMGNLGNAYSKLPGGPSDVNLARAVDCFLSALEVCTQERAPEEFALLQHNLGCAYYALSSGDRATNLCAAIERYQAALSVWTQGDFPGEWALLQNSLGAAYAALPPATLPDSELRAVECFQHALRVWTRDVYPRDWALASRNLANAHLRVESETRSRQVTRALECYRAVLCHCPEVLTPDEWAETVYRMGVAYLDPDCPADDCDPLREAERCFLGALSVWTQDAYPRHHTKALEGLTATRSGDHALGAESDLHP